jgi:hypothetical protein
MVNDILLLKAENVTINFSTKIKLILITYKILVHLWYLFFI